MIMMMFDNVNWKEFFFWLIDWLILLLYIQNSYGPIITPTYMMMMMMMNNAAKKSESESIRKNPMIFVLPMVDWPFSHAYYDLASHRIDYFVVRPIRWLTSNFVLVVCRWSMNVNKQITDICLCFVHTRKHTITHQHTHICKYGEKEIV